MIRLFSGLLVAAALMLGAPDAVHAADVVPSAKTLQASPPEARQAYLSCVQQCYEREQCGSKMATSCTPTKTEAESTCNREEGMCLSSCRVSCNKSAFEPALSKLRR
jgi:hypothetical protein